MRRNDKIALEVYQKKIDLIRAVSHINPNETLDEQKEAIEKARKDVSYCVTRYFPHYATSPSADFQIQFAKKVRKDPVIKAFAQWGRGLAKSVWCDVFIPFWLWINDEAHYIVLVGTDKDKAAQLLDDLRAEFEANPQIIKDFGEQKLEGKWETGKWQTKGSTLQGLKSFRARARGMSQEVRGLRIGNQRPDLCIADDVETRELIKNPKRQDEYVKWIETSLLPTMDGPIRRLLYANNLFAPRMIQTELQKKHPVWFVHHIPAYDRASFAPVWKEKYPPNYYRDLNTEIGIIALEQEYLQEPVIEGKIFTPSQINWAKLPRLDHFTCIVGHWDIAYAGNDKSDYNAVRIWGLKDGIFWYIRSFVKQTKMRAAVEYICDVQKNLPTSVIIHWQYEAQFWNDEVERTIHETVEIYGRMSLPIRRVDTPRTKKYDRMLTMQPRYQNNRIRYNEAMKSDNDTQTGLAQLYSLEPGYCTHDDAPDADEQCIAFLEKHIPPPATNSGYRSGKMNPVHERL